MPAANIEINAEAFSHDTLPLNVVVQLSNADVGGELTYLWEILDQPEGTADALSSTSLENPTFTPKKEGSYLIRLTVNLGLGSQVINTRIAAVRQLKTNERIPSAMETLEVDTALGWKPAVNRLLSRCDDAIADSNLLVCVNDSVSPPVVGDVVMFAKLATIKSGLPGTETLMVVSKVPVTASGMRASLGVVVATPTGGGTGANVLVVVRQFGLVENANTGSPTVGDLVFVNDASSPSLTPGSIGRAIGRVLSVSGGTYRWVVDGSPGLGSINAFQGKTLTVSAIGNATVISGWAPNGAGYMLSSAAGTMQVGVQVEEGDTLTTVVVSRFGNASATLTVALTKLTAAGGVIGLASVTVVSPPASWGDTSINIATNGTIAAGDVVFFEFVSSAAALRVGTCRVTRNHVGPT